jgi:hypothetical protein
MSLDKNLCRDNNSVGHKDLFSIDKYTCVKKTNLVEYKFYKHVIKNNLKIKQHIPKFKGLYNTNYIQFENIKANMKKPKEIDIKLGKHTVNFQNLRDQNMHLVKAIVKTSKMVIRNTLTNRYVDYFASSNNKYIGLDPKTMFKKYFGTHHEIKSHVVKKIKQIIIALNELQNIRIIGMSLLIVYDQDNPKNIKVKLIDFAHTMFVDDHHKSLDHVIKGLENIITYLSPENS